MIAYGARRGTPQADFEKAVRDKGGERLRVRITLQGAVGPVPRSLTGRPCQCWGCRRDPAWAEYVWHLEAEEHSHLDEIL